MSNPNNTPMTTLEAIKYITGWSDERLNALTGFEEDKNE